MTKKSIPRTKDATLDAMIRIVEKWRGKRVRQNKPQYKHKDHPRVEHIALTHISSRSDENCIGRLGALIKVPFRTSFRDNVLYVETRVGDAQGTGRDVRTAQAPSVNGIRQLSDISEVIIQESVRRSAEEFYQARGGLYTAEGEPLLWKLKEMSQQKEPYLETPPKKIYPSKKLRDILKSASKILNGHRHVKESQVLVNVFDETRRYVNSEGTVVRDAYYAIEIAYHVKIKDKEGRWLDFYDRECYSDPSWLDVKKSAKRARRLMKFALERRDCPTIRPGIVDVVYDPGPFCTEIHEAVVHMFASNEILHGGATAFGIENFDQQVAPEELSIYSNPNTKHWWSSYVYDQEGVLGRRKALIENGIQKGFLADRHGAAVLEQRLKDRYSKDIEIHPGDSRTQVCDYPANAVAYPALPRISNLEVSWCADKKPKNKTELMKQFRKLLAQSGREYGIYFTEIGTPGECETDTGVTQVYSSAPFMFTRKGKLIPIKPVFTVNTAHNILCNIVTMGQERVYVPHYCGAELDEFGDEYEGDLAFVKAGITVAPGIIRDVQIDLNQGDIKGY